MSENMKLPKILIFGETFKKTGGGGITLNTLFGDWPHENISMLSDRVGEISEIHFTHFYQIGNLENKTLLSKFGIKTGNISGAKTFQNNKKDQIITPEYKSLSKNKLYFRLKDTFIYIISSLGLYDFFFKTNVSDELVQWINQVKPDIIYFQPGSTRRIKLLLEIHAVTKIPYIIHVMDNFLDPKIQSKIFNNKNKNEVQSIIEEMVTKSNLCLSICDEMSSQYEKNFGRKFHSFQHAVDSKFWNTDYTVKETPSPFIILYAGRIGIGTKRSIIALAKAIEICNKKYNTNFEFQIQTTSAITYEIERLSNNEYIKINTSIPYNDLPKRYAQADLLVLPMDFDKTSLAYIKYSMPTKVPEYLVTGVPILVLASELTALYKYAKSENWAFLNNTEDIIDIENILIEIKGNYLKRVQISEVAKLVGKKNHDVHAIRDSFKKLLMDAIYSIQ
jgi:glycosyltransferase involved in cell wall biosynthesis